MRQSFETAVAGIATLIIVVLIILGLYFSSGCAPESRSLVPRTQEQKVQSFIRIFTDPNMAPILRHLRIKQMEAIMEKELEELDRERALNTI